MLSQYHNYNPLVILSQIFSPILCSGDSSLCPLQVKQKVAEGAAVLATVALHCGVVRDGLGHVQGVGQVGARDGQNLWVRKIL